MTVATWDHHDLYARDYATHYAEPEFSGYPEERDEVRVVYRSKRTGDLTRRQGLVRDVCTTGHSVGTADPRYLELTVDTGDADLKVWGGGNYSPDARDREGAAPAQVWTESFVQREGSRTQQQTIRGRLVRLEAPQYRLVLDVKDIPEDRVKRIEKRIEGYATEAVNDSTAQHLLETSVTREKLPVSNNE